MSTRERTYEQPPTVSGGTEPGSEGAALGEARSAGQKLLDAGDAAMARALSRNGEQFLRLGRQEGGQ
jgi:hypothetical protein